MASIAEVHVNSPRSSALWRAQGFPLGIYQAGIDLEDGNLVR